MPEPTLFTALPSLPTSLSPLTSPASPAAPLSAPLSPAAAAARLVPTTGTLLTAAPRTAAPRTAAPLAAASPTAASPTAAPLTAAPPAAAPFPPDAMALPPAPPRARALAVLLALEAVLAFMPVVVLGAAIGWPASLDWPAARQLAAVAAAPTGVTVGYGLYLLYSVLILPLMIGLAARLPGGLAHPLGASVAAFGAASALARAVGILRWLTVMPLLAREHAAAGPAERERIEAQFTALTTYGGGIGEVLGVSLLMALSLGLLCAAAWWGPARAAGVAVPRSARRAPVMPVALAALGLVVSLLLAGLSLPNLGVSVDVPVAAAVSLLSLWMLAMAAWLWRRP